jgi:prophage DNA circulation protein
MREQALNDLQRHAESVRLAYGDSAKLRLLRAWVAQELETMTLAKEAPGAPQIVKDYAFGRIAALRDVEVRL